MKNRVMSGTHGKKSGGVQNHQKSLNRNSGLNWQKMVAVIMQVRARSALKLQRNGQQAVETCHHVGKSTECIETPAQDAQFGNALVIMQVKAQGA